jgi:hypothetical protein
MAETVAQTWTRLTGLPWSASRAYGSGTASANLELQRKLLSGWRPNANTPTPIDNRTELQRFAEEAARQRNEQIANQNRLQEELFSRYESTLANQEKPSAAYERLSQAANIPQLKEQLNIFKGQIFNIKNLLDRLNEDINSRVAGTFTTEAQARRIEAKEGSDLNTQLARLGAGMQPLVEQLMGAQEDIRTRLGLLQQEQQLELDPLRLRISALSDRFAREISGFDRNKEIEFNALADKLERERALQDREWQRLQQLAAEQRAYARERQKAQEELAQREASLRAAGIDPATGRPIISQPQSMIPPPPRNLNSPEGARWIRIYGPLHERFTGASRPKLVF